MKDREWAGGSAGASNGGDVPIFPVSWPVCVMVVVRAAGRWCGGQRDCAFAEFGPSHGGPGFRLRVEELRRHLGYRGQEHVDLGTQIAVDGVLDPRIVGDAARAGRYDPQTVKNVWHYLARFGAPWKDAADSVSPELVEGAVLDGFSEWTAARVWAKLHHLVLDELGARGELDWSRYAIDSVNMRALKGGS
ncbi:hypothetical protein GCM10010347_64770 [Streptomyces cirratus]|uniref:Uncharacterized protein n=1 Tax=Streptomyces cirratus TaxID=68187 RepID=A0ABQ3F5B6_9ACTN|nr:hypothetical protein GCM10010347_64770 [Streptomyces cirratus]